MENHLMGTILNQNTNPRREAKAWLKANPEQLAAWLQGVSPFQNEQLTQAQ